eukprot:m.11415 g.11415  ORF g.11415 m.11415 type:complete len:101 (-) comp5720_c0_seq1:45-347(-)
MAAKALVTPSPAPTTTQIATQDKVAQVQQVVHHVTPAMSSICALYEESEKAYHADPTSFSLKVLKTLPDLVLDPEFPLFIHAVASLPFLAQFGGSQLLLE